MLPLQGRTVRTMTALGVCAALSAAGALVVPAAADATTSSRSASRSVEQLIASDNMQRQVAVGLGSAARGGRYEVSTLRGARVRNDYAVLGPVQPGHNIAAWLPQVRSRDVRVATTFRLGAHGGLGKGEYFEIGLRRVSPSTMYLAKIRVVPGQGAFASVSRLRNGKETFLSAERKVLPASAVRGWMRVSASAVGTYPVELGVRVWRGGAAMPSSDQVRFVDDGNDRITAGGAVAFTSYLSHLGSGTSVVDFRRVRVWNQPSRGLGGQPIRTDPPVSTPPVTTPPVTTPPVSTPPVTIAPGTAAGALPIGQASYPVPATAVFVSPSGNDSASGTQANPLKTLARALSVAPSGGTIVLRAGSYNESVQDNTKPLTVENYPGEAVWLDGSTVVTGWAQQGNTWVHTGWTAQFSSVPSYTGTVSSAPGWSFTNSAHPMAAYPDQMWMDGSPLTQVGSAAAVGPGEFFADYADDELVIGSNPAGHEMRASNLGTALTSYAANFTIRGIGVRRYATAVNQFGALRLLGAGDVVQNVQSSQNATTGIMLNGVNEVADHDTVTDNGMLGLTGTYADGLVVNGLLAEDNNTQGFSMSPVSGGMKIARSRGVTVENSEFADNYGPGAWFDESVYNATIVNNVMADNAGHGLSYEISSTALIANNVVENNGGDGLKINDSDHVRIWNNTLLNNGRDIELVEDLRRGSNLSDPGHNPHVAQPDPTEPWTITNDSIMNNIFSPSGGAYQLYVYDYSKQYSADGINLQVDGNQFVRGTSAAMIVWGQAASNPKLFSTAAAFIAGTGQGAGNTDVSPTQAVQGNAGGVALPSDVAAAIDQPVGTQHLGSFLSV